MLSGLPVASWLARHGIQTLVLRAVLRNQRGSDEREDTWNSFKSYNVLEPLVIWLWTNFVDHPGLGLIFLAQFLFVGIPILGSIPLRLHFCLLSIYSSCQRGSFGFRICIVHRSPICVIQVIDCCHGMTIKMHFRTLRLDTLGTDDVTSWGFVDVWFFRRLWSWFGSTKMVRQGSLGMPTRFWW